MDEEGNWMGSRYKLFKCTADTIKGKTSLYIIAKNETDACLGAILEPGRFPSRKSSKVDVELIKFDRRKILEV